MAITYVTNINAVSCYPVQPHPDCVFNVAWVVSGTDGTYNAAAYGSTDIPYVASDVYIPYADLTQETVVGWVNEYGGEAVANAQLEVAAAIGLNYSPNEPVSPPLPWNVPSPADVTPAPADVTPAPADVTPAPSLFSRILSALNPFGK